MWVHIWKKAKTELFLFLHELHWCQKQIEWGCVFCLIYLQCMVIYTLKMKQAIVAAHLCKSSLLRFLSVVSMYGKMSWKTYSSERMSWNRSCLPQTDNNLLAHMTAEKIFKRAQNHRSEACFMTRQNHSRAHLTQQRTPCTPKVHGVLGFVKAKVMPQNLRGSRHTRQVLNVFCLVFA